MAAKPDYIEALKNEKCLVCGGTPSVVGVFVPDDPSRFGAPEGKSRVVKYILCQRCADDPTTPDRVEKIILSEMAGGGGVQC